MRIRLLPGLFALAGLVALLASTGGYWTAPRATLDSLFAEAPKGDLAEVWRVRASGIAPIGTPDREVERRFRKAGFDVDGSLNRAILFQEEQWGAVKLVAQWRLDAREKVVALKSESRVAAY